MFLQSSRYLFWQALTHFPSVSEKTDHWPLPKIVLSKDEPDAFHCQFKANNFQQRLYFYSSQTDISKVESYLEYSKHGPLTLNQNKLDFWDEKFL